MNQIRSYLILPLIQLFLFQIQDPVATSSIYNAPFTITALGESDTHLYLGTNHGLITQNKHNKQIEFLTQENSTLPSNLVTSIVCTRDNKAYIGTTNGILIWDKTAYRTLSTANSNLPDNHITVLAIDPEDHVWIGTQNEGLLKSTDKINEYFIRYPIEPTNGKIYSIAFDREASAWVGFQNGGIACLRNGEWQTYPTTQSLEEIQLHNAGSFLLSTATQGTYLSEGSSFRKIPIESKGIHITCTYYNPTYSRLFICYGDGIYKFDINLPLDVPEIITYASLVELITAQCHKKESKQAGHAILNAFNATLD